MAVKDYTELSNQILECVGGRENITGFFHCVTRLRFELKEKSKLDEKRIKGLDGVIGIKWVGNQFQIIIGSSVADVYEKICEISGIKPEDEVAVDDDKTAKPASVADRITNFMKPLVDCVIPLMGLFIATGLVKGILSALTVFGVLAADSGTYTFLYAMSDSLFYFFPIFIGFTAGKVFKTNQFMTAAIGAALVYPTIVAAVGQPLTLFGIPVNVISYTYSILPVFFASMLAAVLEKFFSKICPKSLKYMLPIALTLVIVVPVTFLVIGPVMTLIANGIGAVITAVWNAVPAVGGFLIGGLWQILVMTGMHTGMTPLILQLLGQYGYDVLGVCVTCSMLALAGCAMAMWLASKQASKKEAAMSAAVSAMLGVTEPAIYGVTLPNPKAMASMIIGGGVGGAVGAVLGVKVFGFGGSALLQLPFTISPDGMMNTILWAVCIAIAFGIAFAMTYILCKKDFAKD